MQAQKTSVQNLYQTVFSFVSCIFFYTQYLFRFPIPRQYEGWFSRNVMYVLRIRTHNCTVRLINVISYVTVWQSLLMWETSSPQIIMLAGLKARKISEPEMYLTVGTKKWREFQAPAHGTETRTLFCKFLARRVNLLPIPTRFLHPSPSPFVFDICQLRLCLRLVNFISIFHQKTLQLVCGTWSVYHEWMMLDTRLPFHAGKKCQNDEW